MALTSGERALLERRLLRLRRRHILAPRLTSLASVLFIGAPVATVALGASVAAAVYVSLAGELRQGVERLQALDRRQIQQTSRIYDRNGVLLRELNPHGERRTYIPLAEIPLVLRQATIAVEDESFYTNPGVDIGGVLRAMFGELTGQPSLGGGSTITQQFVRHVAFTDQERFSRSYARKLKEIVLAMILTHQTSKDQILEWYLNEIYYGNFAYGIEAASQTIFGKPARNLDLAESALLAGLPKAPARLDPLNPDPAVQERVRERQRLVLRLMVEDGFITSPEAEAAGKAELAYREAEDDPLVAPHFVYYVQDVLQEMLGAERLARGGLTITTTLDLSLQELAQQRVSEQVERLRERQNLSNAALVAIEPRTGQVLAMVGSADFFDETIDGEVNVARRERQPGSSIKPIAYLAAIEEGMPTSTVLWDTPLRIWTVGGLYEPHNYDETFHGPVRLRAALANSYNIPALKLLLRMGTADNALAGVQKTIDMAHRLGVKGLQQPAEYYGISITLGGGEVTLLDMVEAFATIANGGLHVGVHPVLEVADRSGNLIYRLADDEEALRGEQVVDERATYIITHVLSDNSARAPAFGENSPLNIGVPAAAKTGTTDQYRDNWTLGFTPYLVTGVWAGNSDNSPMVRSSGVTGAAPIWGGFMRSVVYDRAHKSKVVSCRKGFGFEVETDFKRPPGIIERPVCRLSSLNRIASGCPELETELFTAEMLGLPETSSAAVQEQAPAPDAWQLVQAVAYPVPPPELAETEQRRLNFQPAPAYLCLPTGPGAGDEKAQPVAVLPLPVDEEERQSVIDWARRSGWGALEPHELCTPPMADVALAPGSLASGYAPGSGVPSLSGSLAVPAGYADYRLNLAPESRISARTVLTGTVLYDPAVVSYYKVELGRGRQPTEWLTIGTTHSGPVVDADLEVLDAPSLPAGDYVLRLVLVKIDGNFVGPPHAVPIRIEH